MSFEERLTRAWQCRGPLALALWPLSLLYGAVVGWRRLAFRRGWRRSSHPGLPTIVVGNRIAGGAGKTPVVIAVARHLRERGLRPGIVSRGHGRSGPGAIRAVGRRDDAADVGDEPLLLALRTGAPVVVGRDRVAAAAALSGGHPSLDVIVSDDGAQHLRLARDIEILVFDSRGAGNGWLLPAGPLREPLDVSSTARRTLVLYSDQQRSTELAGSTSTRRLAGLVALDDWWAGRPAQAALLAEVGERARLEPASVVAAAGIAQPQRFFEMLAAQDVDVRGIALPDHADFTTLPWGEASDVIVTEKDAVKLRPQRLAAERPGQRVWVAPLDFEPEAAFWQQLDAALDEILGARD